MAKLTEHKTEVSDFEQIQIDRWVDKAINQPLTDEELKIVENFSISLEAFNNLVAQEKLLRKSFSDIGQSAEQNYEVPKNNFDVFRQAVDKQQLERSQKMTPMLSKWTKLAFAAAAGFFVVGILLGDFGFKQHVNELNPQFETLSEDGLVSFENDGRYFNIILADKASTSLDELNLTAVENQGKSILVRSSHVLSDLEINTIRSQNSVLFFELASVRNRDSIKSE